MKVTLKDIEATIDINDDDQLIAAVEAIVAKDLRRISPNNHTKALKGLLQNLRYWFIKNGALIVGAHAGGYEGVGLQSAIDSHNFIAALLSEAPLTLDRYPQVQQDDDVEMTVTMDEPQLEGGDSMIVDAQGRPIPPGQLPTDEL
jgi:hypothetical protein